MVGEDVTWSEGSFLSFIADLRVEGQILQLYATFVQTSQLANSAF
jgi:hypothetical protein